MNTEQQRKAEEIYNRLIDIQHRMEWIAQDPGVNIEALPKVVEDFEKFFKDREKFYSEISNDYYANTPYHEIKMLDPDDLPLYSEMSEVINHIRNLCIQMQEELDTIPR